MRAETPLAAPRRLPGAVTTVAAVALVAVFSATVVEASSLSRGPKPDDAEDLRLGERWSHRSADGAGAASLQRPLWRREAPAAAALAEGAAGGRAATAGCNPQCREPNCVPGADHNGGVGLVDGKCLQFCSKATKGTRFCGSGLLYKDAGSIDCKPCASDNSPGADENLELDTEPKFTSGQMAGYGARRFGIVVQESDLQESIMICELKIADRDMEDLSGKVEFDFLGGLHTGDAELLTDLEMYRGGKASEDGENEDAKKCVAWDSSFAGKPLLNFTFETPQYIAAMRIHTIDEKHFGSEVSLTAEDEADGIWKPVLSTARDNGITVEYDNEDEAMYPVHGNAACVLCMQESGFRLPGGAVKVEHHHSKIKHFGPRGVPGPPGPRGPDEPLPPGKEIPGMPKRDMDALMRKTRQKDRINATGNLSGENLTAAAGQVKEEEKEVAEELNEITEELKNPDNVSGKSNEELMREEEELEEEMEELEEEETNIEAQSAEEKSKKASPIIPAAAALFVLNLVVAGGCFVKFKKDLQKQHPEVDAAAAAAASAAPDKAAATPPPQ